jgi:hypothetical protein
MIFGLNKNTIQYKKYEVNSHHTHTHTHTLIAMAIAALSSVKER